LDNEENNINFNFNLSSSERLELERIVLDKDAGSALNFIKQHNITANEAEPLKYCSQWLKKVKKAEEEKLKIRFSDKGPSINI